MRGSGPILLALLLLFAGLFWWQRGRSSFLAIEREATVLREVASRCGLDRPSVMALRELLGQGLPLPEFEARCAGFAALRGEIGEPLAAVAATGDPVLVRQAFARGNGDAAVAWARFRPDPMASAGERFLALRARFAARSAARD